MLSDDDFDLFVNLALQLAVLLLEDLDGNLRFAFCHMKIGDEKAVLVDEEPRTQPAGRPHLHHGRAQFGGQFAHACAL